MAYKSAALQEPTRGNERVDGIIDDINALSYTELQLLRHRLNSQMQPTHDASNNGVRLDGKVVRLLSRREIDVLTLVAAGYSRKEIGESLDITSNTAAKHVSSIYRKLNISSIAEATRIALEDGILASRSIRSR